MSSPTQRELKSLISDRSIFLQKIIAGPKSKRELTEVTDYSRSTIDRALRSLAEANLVEYTDGEWHATAIGISLYRQHKSYTNFVNNLSNAVPILTEIPPEKSVSEQFLTGCTPHTSSKVVPDAVLAPLLDSVRMATSVRGIVPRAFAASAADFYDCATDKDSYNLELVIAGPVLNIISDLHRENMNDAFEDPNVTIYRGEIPVPYGIWISDSDEAGIVVYSDKGFQGTIINDTEASIDWATGHYRSVKQDAEKICCPSNIISD